MNRADLFELLQPTETELQELHETFKNCHVDILERSPYLIAMRRAVRAGFYTDAVDPPAA